jgi:hypothetical protein
VLRINVTSFFLLNMQRTCTFLDLLLVILGLLILAALGLLVFVMATDAVSRHLRWAAALGLLVAAGLFGGLAAWLAFRNDNAWLRTLRKAEAEAEERDESLRDSAIVA